MGGGGGRGTNALVETGAYLVRSDTGVNLSAQSSAAAAAAAPPPPPRVLSAISGWIHVDVYSIML